MKFFKMTRKQAADVLALTFPQYEGRKIRFAVEETVWFHDTNWSGGTKNEYAAVRFGESARLVVGAPWNNPIEGVETPLPEDTLLVEHSYYCGKDLGITIYVHPNSLPKWLEAKAN